MKGNGNAEAIALLGVLMPGAFFIGSSLRRADWSDLAYAMLAMAVQLFCLLALARPVD